MDDSRQKKDSSGRTLEEISRLIRLNPKDPQLHFELGQVYKELGRTEDCLREWKKVIELDPNNLRTREAIEELLRENASKKKAPPSGSR